MTKVNGSKFTNVSQWLDDALQKYTQYTGDEQDAVRLIDLSVCILLDTPVMTVRRLLASRAPHLEEVLCKKYTSLTFKGVHYFRPTTARKTNQREAIGLKFTETGCHMLQLIRRHYSPEEIYALPTPDQLNRRYER